MSTKNPEKGSQTTHDDSDEPEDNAFLCNGDGTLRPIGNDLTDDERARRKFERERLDSRFEAYLPMWLTFGTWSLDEACRLLAGIPIRERISSDLDDRAHFRKTADYKLLLLVAETYENLSSGATPAEWIDWFKTCGVVKQISGVPSIVALPSDNAENANTMAIARSKPDQQYQEEEIIRVIRNIGHDPRQLPKNSPGKPGVKAEVREKLSFSTKVFDKAWERLRAAGDIADK